MGVLAGFSGYARACPGAGRRYDRGKASRSVCQIIKKPDAAARLIGFVLLLLLFQGGTVAAAETLRVATWHADLSRRGPGLLLRDIQKDEKGVAAIIGLIAEARPDILVLTDVDHDHGHVALKALIEALDRAETGLVHGYAAAPNSGVPTGMDMDENGKLGEARDAQGYGRFSGDGGIAIVSRWPIDAGAVIDFSALLWRDLPGNRLAPEEREDPKSDIQRLSSRAHWIVPVNTSAGRLDLWVFGATPPVFDGPEDRNGRRNADEIALWRHVIDGTIPGRSDAPFVIAGLANLDPVDGEGLHGEIQKLLSDNAVIDPRPKGEGGEAAANPAHQGDPALDTVDLTDPRPGNLRLSYVLPSAELGLHAAGVVWPDKDATARRVKSTERHKMVWVDIQMP